MNDSKKTILVVDDSELNRALLVDMLENDFKIIEAQNGLEAMAALVEHEMEISLMLLDIVMPEMDGFEVLAMMNKQGYIKTIPVIMISAESGGSVIDRAYDLGAIDYINRPFDERTVKHRVMSNFVLTLKQKELSEMLSEQIYEKEKNNSLMIEILSHIVEFRNGESGLHVLHVHTITDFVLKAIVKKTNKYGLTPKDIRLIDNASALHDIGKISVPSEVLNKPGRFTPEEFEIMKRHTVEGANMLDNLPFHKDEALVKYAYQICRWHHERYDGRGYPDGLKGDEIPIAAQAVSLADVYDALTSERIYKPALSHERAIEMILNNECGVFNPLLVECLKDIAPTLKKELEVISFGRASEDSIDESVRQIMRTDGNEISSRTLNLIEHERLKFKYLADISGEITFEYIAAPEMLKLSDWGADVLGVPSNILDPLNNKKWCGIFRRDDFDDFIKRIHATTPEHPVATAKYKLVISGEERWNKVIAKVMFGGDTEAPEFEGAICKITDINDEVLTLANLEEKAERDQLTGLFNREAARVRISKLLTESNGKKYALAFLDFDDFKQANDRHGHQFGDETLIEFARRIRANIRANDIAARVGGDEFIIFMEYKDNVEAQVARIHKRMTGDFKGFYIGISMGVACADENCIDFDELYHKADVAAYSVKRATKNAYKIYNDSLSELLGDDGE